MKRLCGIRPSGRLHLGHYFSVIKPAQEYECQVLVAVHHAPQGDYQSLINNLLSFRLRTKVQEINPNLYFKLLELAKIGELMNMTQFKSGEQKTAHLLTYPVLMAHDVADYDEVYVGDDQKQHLEYARKLLRRYNERYPENSVMIPDSKIVGGRIMDLKDPTKKMSKSSPKGCLFLDDDPYEIGAKIQGATTTQEGIKNLNTICREFMGVDFPKDDCDQGKRRLAAKLSKRFNYEKVKPSPPVPKASVV